MTDSYGPFPTEGQDQEPEAPTPPEWVAPDSAWASAPADPTAPVPPVLPVGAAAADQAPYGLGGRRTPPPLGGGTLGSPWGPSYIPPATPTGSGWPPPQQPPPARARSSIALALVAAVIAAFVGVMVGSSLFHRPAATVSANTPIPSSPFIPSSPGGGTTPPPPSPSVATPAAEQAVRDKVDVGVVDINTKLKYQSASAAGTGMILTSNGEILTNNHVVDGATSIEAVVVTTGRKYTAHVVGTDPTEDVAVIQLDNASGLTPIRTASTPAATGDIVFAIGNAGGVGGTPSVGSGTVQAVNQTITASDQGGANAEQLSGLIQTNAPMQPGDSGGPLANKAAQVVGMDTAASGRTRFESAVSVGFAIPIAHALAIAHQIDSGQASATIHIGVPGAIGVTVDPAASGSSGAVVSSVLSGSPAASAGLSVGDTITAVDGQRVSSADALTTILHRHHPGDRIVMTWTDGSGATNQKPLTLMTGPAD